MNVEGNQCPPDDPKLTFSLARKTNDFMTRQVADGHPFFVQVSFYANHLKYMALPDTIEKYEAGKDMATKYQHSALWAAMHEDMDTAIGSIVETVEQLGVRENTYFIYTADNGYESKVDQWKPVEERTWHKAHPLLSHKYMISEGGLRVPLCHKRSRYSGWKEFPCSGGWLGHLAHGSRYGGSGRSHSGRCGRRKPSLPLSKWRKGNGGEKGSLYGFSLH